MDPVTNNLIETLAAGVNELRAYENDIGSREWAQEELRRIDRQIQDLLYAIEQAAEGEYDQQLAEQEAMMQDAFFDEDERGGY